MPRYRTTENGLSPKMERFVIEYMVDYNGKRDASVAGFLYNQKDELCAKSKGHFAVLSPQLAKKIGMMTDEHIKEFFEPLIPRQKRKEAGLHLTGPDRSIGK